MRVDNISNLNFKLNIVKPVTIQKKEENGEYKPYIGHLTEFNINNPNEMEKFKEICYAPGFSFYSYGLTSFADEKAADGITKRCFVLLKDAPSSVSQVDKNNALGIFTFEESSDDTAPDRVVFFITNKKYRTKWFKDVRENEFKDIGNGMSDAIKEIFSRKSIKCFADPGAVAFWTKNCYKEIGDGWVMLHR